MMLKEKKIDFQRGCEEYIEEQGLYEIFEDMMRSLIVNRPADPIQHLVEKLERPERKYKKNGLSINILALPYLNMSDFLNRFVSLFSNKNRPRWSPRQQEKASRSRPLFLPLRP